MSTSVLKTRLMQTSHIFVFNTFSKHVNWNTVCERSSKYFNKYTICTNIGLHINACAQMPSYANRSNTGVCIYLFGLSCGRPPSLVTEDQTYLDSLIKWYHDWQMQFKPNKCFI